jgi:hypothetical protein
LWSFGRNKLLLAHCGVTASSAHSPYRMYGSLRASAVPCTASKPKAHNTDSKMLTKKHKQCIMQNMTKKNPAEFPIEHYQGRDLSTMDVSLERIGSTALTLEEHQAGMSMIAPEPRKEKHVRDENDLIRTNVTTADIRDPRLHGGHRGNGPTQIIS